METGDKDPVRCNVLLDTASSFNFITKAKVGDILSVIEQGDNRLRVLERQVPLQIKMLNTETSTTADLIQIGLHQEKGGTPIRIKAYVLERIQTPLNTNDDPVKGPSTLDLLLGVMDVLRIVKGPAVRLANALYLIPTILGDAICGADTPRTRHPPYLEKHPTCLATGTEVLTKTLEKMWTIEVLPFDDAPSSLTKDEAWAVEKIR